jgi:hypothetical protein
MNLQYVLIVRGWDVCTATGPAVCLLLRQSGIAGIVRESDAYTAGLQDGHIQKENMTDGVTAVLVKKIFLQPCGASHIPHIVWQSTGQSCLQ